MITIEAIVSLLVNNGAAIGCLAYFMWFNSKIISELKDLITSVKEEICGVKADQKETNARLESIEIKLEMEADNNESC